MRTYGALKLITGPTVEPCTAAEAASFLRLGNAADLDLVGTMVRAARRIVENETARALLTQTWEYYLDAFPGGDFWSLSRPLGVRPYHREIFSLPQQLSIQVPKPPLQSVAWIKYTDPSGAQQTLDPSLYTVDPISEPARILPIYGQWWPLTQAVPNAVVVRFIAGYGATADTVPEDLVDGLKMLLANLYENRQPVLTDSTVVQMPRAADALLMPYRVSLV